MSALMPSKWPTLATDLFAPGFLSPRLWDFNGDFFGADWATNVPSVNVAENDHNFMIELAASGLEKKDFQISVENAMLTISAEKNEEKNEEKDKYMRREFSFNKFTRSFRLPENCMPDKIDAKYENGVLFLTLPKKDVAMTTQTKEIKVS